MPLGDVPTASEVFASGVGRYFSFEFGFDQAMLMFQPVGGMDRIPKALTRAIGAHRVRTGAVVSKITDTAHGVTVTYAQGGRTKVVEADYCVAALPPNILAKVPHNLGSGVQSALEAITPSSAGKIGLEYRSPLVGDWTTASTAASPRPTMDVTHIWHPSYGFHGRARHPHRLLQHRRGRGLVRQAQPQASARNGRSPRA